jgi:hypothetical protein
MKTHLGETLMKQLLSHAFFEHYLDNYKPSWLEGLELDRYYPSIRTAFEFQGLQHYTYLHHLHRGHDGFYQGIRHDKKKKNILKEKKISLIEVTAESLQPDLFFSTLESTLMTDFSKEKETISYQTHKKIIRYQTGLRIYQSKQKNDLLQQKNAMEQLPIDFFHPTQKPWDAFPYLSTKEKVTIGFLSVFSEKNEVILSFQDAIALFSMFYPTVFHADTFERTCENLVNRNLLTWDKRYGLIKIHPKANERIKKWMDTTFLSAVKPAKENR